MLTHPFHPGRFLQSVYGTEPFVDYCRERGIPFEQELCAPLGKDDARRWASALAQMPHERNAQTELEMATVNAMGGADATAHLIEAADGGDLPPDSVPGGVPLALWFFLRHPSLFREVFLHHEIEDVDSWRTGHAVAGIALSDLDGKAGALAEGLRAFYRPRLGSVPFCSIDAHRLRESFCFVTQVADRLQFLPAFTESGQATTQRLRPAQTTLLVYYPEDGTVLAQSPLRSRQRIADLFTLFGTAVLGCPVASEDAAFDLDPLKEPFHPLPDAQDMEMVRVKALHLRYPARAGRRQLKLETLSSDEPSAIDHLLYSHVGDGNLRVLRVCHAELQVWLRIDGQRKSYAIRLWPNRSNLNQTPLGDRFRSCLERWGLVHAQ